MHCTQGEWYVSPAGSIVLARGEDGTDRIVCHLSLTRGADEAIANGNLVAACPAMLAAIEAADRHIVHLNQCGLCRGGYSRICIVAKQAQAAVSEALRQARQGQEQGVTP